MQDLLGEHGHVRTRIGLFQKEFRDTPAPERRRQLQAEMMHTARESAELARRIEASRLLALLHTPAAASVEARYAFEVPRLDRAVGVVGMYTDGPRGDDGAVLTMAQLRARGEAVRACISALARQQREMEQTRSERKRNLIDAHGRETAEAIRKEMQEFLREFTSQTAQ